MLFFFIFFALLATKISGVDEKSSSPFTALCYNSSSYQLDIDIEVSSTKRLPLTQQYQCGGTSTFCKKGSSSCALVSASSFSVSSSTISLRTRVARLLQEIHNLQKKRINKTNIKLKRSSTSRQIHLFIDPDSRLSQRNDVVTKDGQWKQTLESINSHSPLKLHCNTCITLNSSSLFAMIGWRGYPHSYAVVAEGIAQGLLLNGFSLSFTDAPVYKPEWLKLKDETSFAAATASATASKSSSLSSLSMVNISELKSLPHTISIQRFTSAGSVPVSPNMCIMQSMCKLEEYTVKRKTDKNDETTCPPFLLRSFYPLDLSPHPCLDNIDHVNNISGRLTLYPKVFVFGTTEFQTLVDPLWTYQAKTFMDETVDKSSSLLTSPWRNLHPSVYIIAPSKWSAHGFAAAGVRSSQLIVLPHGIDPSIFHPLTTGASGLLASRNERLALRTTLRWTRPANTNMSISEDCFTILSVGHMRFTKGLDVLLRAVLSAAAELKNDASQCLRLVLKGLDGLYGSSETIKRSLDSILTSTVLDPVQGEVIRTGTQLFADLSSRGLLQMRIIGKILAPSELVKLYQASDAYASPYRAEGFNLPVLEAAACGLPLLVTLGGATDEFTHSSFTLYIKSEEMIGGKEQGMQGRSHHMEPDSDHLKSLILTLSSQYEGNPTVINKNITLFNESIKRAFTNTIDLPSTWRANAGVNAAEYVLQKNLTWKGVSRRLQQLATM
jgi:glycosyltransferase involved in cell wall biosynthesis